MWGQASKAGGAIDFAAAVGPRDVGPLVDAEIRSAGDDLSVVGSFSTQAAPRSRSRCCAVGYEIIGRHHAGVQLEPGQFRDEIIMLATL